MPRTPCESVPSMPARRAYRLRNSGVCCSCRRACKAECAACGRRCSTRPVVWDRVQSLRTGQPAHTSWAKTTSIRSPARLQRSEEHTSELQSPCNLVCRLLLEKKKATYQLAARGHAGCVVRGDKDTDRLQRPQARLMRRHVTLGDAFRRLCLLQLARHEFVRC